MYLFLQVLANNPASYIQLASTDQGSFAVAPNYNLDKYGTLSKSEIL
ncbi:hypothetical protein [Dendronalium sp. ChiSLP03b]|nr:hypothetical protein [Dendronalium sp. ChiSLP03b]MDZ8204293.1 hypothetical protein [Dendronalium sp. ChiSLP03b]